MWAYADLCDTFYKMAGLKLMAPSPRYYAVIRMDPVAMVQGLELDDPQMLEEARKMEPKKYLVYLDRVSCPSRLPQLSLHPLPCARAF